MFYSRIDDGSKKRLPRHCGYWDRLRMLETPIRTSVQSDVSTSITTMPQPMNIIEPMAKKFLKEDATPSETYSLHNFYEEMKSLPIEHKLNHPLKASSAIWADKGERYMQQESSIVLANNWNSNKNNIFYSL